MDGHSPAPAVLLRADAGPTIGLGHAMRCLALADELRSRGFRTWFASRELAGAEEPVRSAGHAILMLRHHDDAAQVQQIHADLGAASAVARPPFRFFVLDHYSADPNEWLQPRLARRRLVIDDVPGRHLACELLVNPAPETEATAYADLLPMRTRVLLGPRYVPLRRALVDRARTSAHREPGAVRRVLVSMGGSTSNATPLALNAVREAVPEATIDLVGATPDLDGIVPGVTAHVRPHVAPSVTELANLLERADLAVGAGGVSAFERCLMGVPSICIQLAANQAPTLIGLAARGAVWDAGALADVSSSGLAAMIRRLARDVQARASMSQRSRELVDGRGAERIAHELEGARMRAPRPGDIGLLWRWRNDPETRRNSTSQHAISWDTHQKWFAAAVADPGTVLLVGENRAGLLGHVRFEPRGRAIEVSIVTDPIHRGAVGSVLLHAALRSFQRRRGQQLLVARVRTDNRASRRLFESAGFQETARRGELVQYELEPTPLQSKEGR